MTARRFADVILRELREALPATLFFFAAFHMIAVTKTVILADYQLDAARSAFATVAALIVAKSILLVENTSIARLFSRPRLANVFWKTLLFGVVASVFRVLEEVVPAMSGHEGLFVATRQAFSAVSWAHFWMIEMWLLALLFLYCLATELVRIIGPEKVRSILLSS
jgi:hypothetical protein